MHIEILLSLIPLIIFIGMISGGIYLIVSIFRYFNDIRELKFEQNQLLSQIHQELEKGNNVWDENTQ